MSSMNSERGAGSGRRPTAAELVGAVAEFVESDVRQATGDDVAGRGDVGQVNFHARVAANVLRIVERELLGDGEPAAASAQLGFADEPGLAAAIRDGRLDDREQDVTRFLRELVARRLSVDHPGYAVTAIADRLFSAIEAGDVDTVASMWSDDVTVWHISDGRTRDKARALRVINWLVSVTNDRQYDVLSRHTFVGGFVQQHLLHGTGRDGTPYALRVALIIRVGADGLITHIDEYFDPADLAPLRDQSAGPSRR
jgi:ketosteroid isomerase-like protein